MDVLPLPACVAIIAVFIHAAMIAQIGGNFLKDGNELQILQSSGVYIHSHSTVCASLVMGGIVFSSILPTASSGTQ